ncbi:hypothetical protein BV25DRAFT_1819014 [Artomyces pyxidatus]|uniref:Uncharacterized protein n=1 Tax=Artomyces pyxidatus TaxID=48021 RepID=A0ACB8TGS5_9AGAM|nr:hypothetical protein BV25DRAFT_1819014 [Artomyces pyxidatus]
MILEHRSEHVDERAKIDTRLHELTQEIISLKVQRNAISPISFLPDELLFRIILQYALSGDVFSGHWVKVMLVCRRWYDVALSHAQLWSYISDSSRRSYDIWEMLERSGDCSLSCTFRHLGESGYLVQAVLEKHMYRVRSLKIHCMEKLLPLLFKEGHRWPILEHLALESWGSNNTHLPPSIFEHGMPRLHSLELNHIGISGWHCFSNLTNLSLSQGHERAFPSPSFDELLAILRRSPSIREIQLHNYLPDDEAVFATLDQIYTQISPIELWHLEHLDLVARFESVDALLRCVILAPTASLHLIVRGIYEGWEIPSLLVPIHRHLRQPGAPALRSLNLKCTPHTYASITADAALKYESDLLVNDRRPHFNLITHPSQQTACRTVFTKVLNALPLDNAEHVTLTSAYGHELSTATWRTVFRHLPCTKVVRIGVNEGMIAVLEGIMDAIKRCPQGLWGARRRRAARGLFAWPTHLSLMALNDGGTGVPDPVAQKHYYDSLVRLLSEYRDMDAPLKPAGVCWPTLEIDSIRYGYLMCYQYRDALFAVVQNLIVDGKPWDPVSYRKSLKAIRREAKKIREEYGIPESEARGEDDGSEGSDLDELDPVET